MAPKVSKKADSDCHKKTKKTMGEHKKTRHPSFVSYIAKVVHGSKDLRVTRKCMLAMESMLKNVMWKIIKEAEMLVHSAGQTSLKADDFDAAVKIVIPGTLGAHAHTAGKAAETKYAAAAK